MSKEAQLEILLKVYSVLTEIRKKDSKENQIMNDPQFSVERRAEISQKAVRDMKRLEDIEERIKCLTDVMLE